jgi:hypothetical protein
VIPSERDPQTGPAQNTVSAKRFNSHGKGVEDVEIMVTMHPEVTFIHVTGEKTQRNYALPTELWRTLAETGTPKIGDDQRG